MFRNILNFPKLIKIANEISILSTLKEEASIREIGMYVREELETMGPTFIKLGQMLSLRYDLFPDAFCEELQKLLDEVKAVDSEVMFQIIKYECPELISNLAAFDKIAIGSASLAQVYKAKLHSGEKVVIKIKRPGVDNIVKSDINFIKSLILLTRNTSFVKRFSLVTVIKEFTNWSGKELDFNQELENIQLFQGLFSNHKFVSIPKTYPQYCNKHMIVMEFMEGSSLYSVMQSPIEKKLKRKIRDNLVELFYLQNFELGVFHADPHPANIFVDKEGNLTLLDFGIIGYLEPRVRNAIINLIRSLNDQNLDMIIETLKSEIYTDPSGHEDWEEFRRLLFEYLLKFKGKNISQISTTEFMIKIIYISALNGIPAPPDLVLFIKQLVSYDGIALKLEPSFSFLDALKPYFEKLMYKEVKAEELREMAIKYKDLIKKLPSIADKLDRLLK